MEWHERARNRLKLRELHALEVVVQAGSMAKAAVHLALSQSAVSKSITEMERTLGITLLERTSRGVEPTPYADILLKHSVAMFDELSQGLTEIEYLKDPSRGHLRIGTPEPMTAIVAIVIDRLLLRHPRLTFDVTVSDSLLYLSTELRQRNLDLAIFRVASASARSDLKSEVLFQDPLVVMTGKQNPRVGRRNLLLSDLIDEPWILPPPEVSIGQFVAEAFRVRHAAQYARYRTVHGHASEGHAAISDLPGLTRSTGNRLA